MQKRDKVVLFLSLLAFSLAGCVKALPDTIELTMKKEGDICRSEILTDLPKGLQVGQVAQWPDGTYVATVEKPSQDINVYRQQGEDCPTIVEVRLFDVDRSTTETYANDGTDGSGLTKFAKK